MSINRASTINPETRASTQPAGFMLNKFGLIIAAALLVLAAWAGQTLIVILIGLVLSAAGLSRLWSHFSLTGIYCERLLTERRVFPGEFVELKIRVANRKLLPLPWIEVQDEVPAGFAPDLPPGDRPGFNLISHSTSLLWYSAISWKYRLNCKKRGYYPLGPLAVSTGDIFGFYPRTATEPKMDYLIVYPRIYTLGQLAIPSLYPLGEARSENRIFEDPSRSIGLRDYSPGDSLRRIHWKASARHQQLQVKVFEPTTTLKAAIFLAVDTFQYDGTWKEDELELGISTAGTLASYLTEKNSQVGLCVNSRLADSGQPAKIIPAGGVDQLLQILEMLAKVVPASSGPFVDFFQRERQDLPLGTTLIFIFSQVPANLKAILSDLRECGYKLLVFQTGQMKIGEAVPDITWYNIPQPEALAEIHTVEYLC